MLNRVHAANARMRGDAAAGAFGAGRARQDCRSGASRQYRRSELDEVLFRIGKALRDGAFEPKACFHRVAPARDPRYVATSGDLPSMEVKR